VFTSRTKAFTTFGWSGRDVAGERMIVKTGGQPGVSARLTLLPMRKISIAVISNRDGTRKLVADTTSEIASALMPDWSNPDFQMDDVPSPDAGTRDYDGSWTGTMRNGNIIESISLLINAGGDSTCIVGSDSARSIRDMTNHSPTLTFVVDGGLSDAGMIDGSVQRLDFKLIAREKDIIGRCLSLRNKPGFTSTLPHIVTLSRSS
jgi:hypothetical protein